MGTHITRGGSWHDTPDDARSANRGANTIDYSRLKVGFRCVASGHPQTLPVRLNPD